MYNRCVNDYFIQAVTYPARDTLCEQVAERVYLPAYVHIRADIDLSVGQLPSQMEICLDASH